MKIRIKKQLIKEQKYVHGGEEYFNRAIPRNGKNIKLYSHNKQTMVSVDNQHYKVTHILMTVPEVLSIRKMDDGRALVSIIDEKGEEALKSTTWEAIEDILDQIAQGKTSISLDKAIGFTVPSATLEPVKAPQGDLGVSQSKKPGVSGPGSDYIPVKMDDTAEISERECKADSDCRYGEVCIDGKCGTLDESLERIVKQEINLYFSRKSL